MIRCDCCGRAINPLNAVRWTMKHEWPDGAKSERKMIYGPVCAVKHGVISKAPAIRKPSRFAIFSKTSPVRQEDGQEQLFGVTA